MTENPSAAGLRKRACTNCTNGKSKCTPFSATKCERCHRLEKECIYGTVSAFRKKPKANLRLRMLERRVEELVARQSSSPNNDASRNATPHTSLPDRGHSATVGSSSFVCVDTSSSSASHASGSQSSSSITNSTPSTVEDFSEDVIDRGLLTLQSAEAAINQFRIRAAAQFPFVIIPIDMTVDAIRKETPFLFLTAVAVMSFNNPGLQLQLGEEARLQLFRRVLFSCDKSLELLQGTLVYAAWYFYFLRRDKHDVFMITQLCVTLAQDLGLDKSVDRLDDATVNGSDIDPSSSASAKNAQMRAYLGTYYLSCSVASNMRRRSAMAHTKYTEQCCQKLAVAQEYSTDELVIPLVKIQQLARRVFDTFSYDDLNNAEIDGEFMTGVTVDALMRDLQSLRLSIGPSLQQNVRLKLEFDILSVRIHEVALHDRFWDLEGFDYTSNTSRLSNTRTKMLWNSIQSCKSLIRSFSSSYSSDIFFTTAFTISKLCYILIYLAKVVRFDLALIGLNSTEMTDGLWPRPRISFTQEIDFHHLTETILQKFSSLATSFVGPDGSHDAMWNLSFMVMILISGYEKEVGELQKAMLNSGVPSKEVNLPPSRNGEEIAFQSINDQGDRRVNDGGNFEASFQEQSSEWQWDSLDSIAWDAVLNDFSLYS